MSAGLGAFTALMGESFNTLDENISSLTVSNRDVTGRVDGLTTQVDKFDKTIDAVKDETRDLRAKFEYLLKHLKNMEKQVDHKILDSRKTTHKELKTHTHTLHSEIGSLKGYVNKSVAEIFALFKDVNNVVLDPSNKVSKGAASALSNRMKEMDQIIKEQVCVYMFIPLPAHAPTPHSFIFISILY